ncbi:unnamed protein product [Lampetra fluviatilis]
MSDLVVMPARNWERRMRASRGQRCLRKMSAPASAERWRCRRPAAQSSLRKRNSPTQAGDFEFGVVPWCPRVDKEATGPPPRVQVLILHHTAMDFILLARWRAGARANGAAAATTANQL